MYLNNKNCRFPEIGHHTQQNKQIFYRIASQRKHPFLPVYHWTELQCPVYMFVNLDIDNIHCKIAAKFINSHQDQYKSIYKIPKNS